MSTSKTVVQRHNEVPFKPRAGLMRTIGEELISDDTVAIVELVKNAYDADAHNVIIEFREPLKKNEGSIIISDDGNGMSYDVVLNAWMQPATSIKRRLKSSPQGRRLLGEKGIGRLAVSRLAKNLELITREPGTNAQTRGVFDWTQYDEDIFLEDVKFHIDEQLPFDFQLEASYRQIVDGDKFIRMAEQGTILRLTSLRSNWDERSLADLRTKLARLVSPFSKSKDFAIYLVLPKQFQQRAGRITAPPSLGEPHYIINGHVDGDGVYDLNYENKVLERSVSFSGRFIRSGVRGDITDWQGKKPRTADFECGPFDIEMRVWDLDSLGENRRRIKEELSEANGVSIYRDGFRVLRYGEPNTDWLRLDIRRVQEPTKRLSNNQILGFITISADDNPELKDQTNREGLQQGKALKDLTDLTKAVLSKLEAERYDDRVLKRQEVVSRQNRNRPAKGQRLFDNINLQRIRAEVQKRHPSDQELLQILDKEERALVASAANAREIISRYSRLATLGQLIDLILHDANTYGLDISLEADTGRKQVEKVEAVIPEGIQIKAHFITIEEDMQSMGALFSSLEPFSGRVAGAVERGPIEEVVSRAIELFSSELEFLGIEIIHPSTVTELSIVPGDIERIFVNLTQNSLYWLEQTDEGTRRIAYQVKRTKPNEVEVLFCDSGPGVPSEIKDEIFKPYYSKKNNGIGLGLTIAGETAAEYGGELRLVSSDLLPGACFSVTLQERD